MDRVEEMVRQAKEKRGYLPIWLREMARTDPEFLEAYDRMYELAVVRSVKIPPKYKQLLIVALLASRMEDQGLKSHLKRAFDLGCTKEEIVEAFQTAYFHTGALTVVHGMRMLVEILAERSGKSEPNPPGG